MDTINTYRAFHPRTPDYIFFSSANGIFSRIDPMLSHKTSLTELRIEIIPRIFSDHNALKLEINFKKGSKETHK